MSVAPGDTSKPLQCEKQGLSGSVSSDSCPVLGVQVDQDGSLGIGAGMREGLFTESGLGVGVHGWRRGGSGDAIGC